MCLTVVAVAHRTKVLSLYKNLLRRYCADLELTDPDYFRERIRAEFKANKELSAQSADWKLEKLEKIVEQKAIV